MLHVILILYLHLIYKHVKIGRGALLPELSKTVLIKLLDVYPGALLL